MVDDLLYPLIVGAVAFVLASLAEALHARRVRRVAGLAFGPTRRPPSFSALWQPEQRPKAGGMEDVVSFDPGLPQPPSASSARAAAIWTLFTTASSLPTMLLPAA